MTHPWYLQMSPESYSRYALLASILHHHFDTDTASILELGGKGSYIGSLFHDRGLPYELTILDVLPPDEPADPRYLQGDATSTGLPDAAFDAVISTDVLEHIPADRKADFIRESVRLARRLVVIAAPFEDPGVAEAEAQANAFYRQLTGMGHPWLTEHEQSGRPSRQLIEDTLTELGLPYIHFGSHPLTVWLPSLILNLLPEGVTVDHTKIAELNQFYNQNLFTVGDTAGPSYRQFYVIFLPPEAPRRTVDYLPEPPVGRHLDHYHRRAHRLLADELASRYARLATPEAADPALQHEIRLLELAQTHSHLSRPQRVLAHLAVAKKALRHPLKSVRYLVRRRRH